MTQNVRVPPLDVAPTTVIGSTPTTAVPFNFPFWDADDIIVLIDGELLSPDAYTVEGLAVQDGEPVVGGYGSGTVTLDSPVSNVTVTIDRSVVGARETQFARSAPLSMPALNADLNRVTARQQDLARRKLNRPSGARAGKFVAFDADGNEVASEGTGADAGLREDLAASTGGTLVAYAPAGAGGQSRSLRTVLRERPVSVLDFGPYPEDGDDYGPALRRALAASGRVFWPKGEYEISSLVDHTLTTDTVIDWNGALVTFTGSGRLNLKSPFVVSSGRTLASNASRWATSTTLNSGTSIQRGDILNIQSSVLPSSDWPDNKQDTVRIAGVSGATITLEDGLNFAWNTTDPDLIVSVLRPAGSVIHRNANFFLDETDGTGVTRICVYHEGVAGWLIDGGCVRGPRPFDREGNIYRNGFVFYYCLNGLIRGLESEAMSYPVLIAGGSRYVREENTVGRYNHHTAADMGGWGSDYELVGLDDQDGFVALSTHACFRARATRCNVRNNTAITAWRCCGGSITDSYLHSTDSTANTVQMQYAAPASGYEYIYTDRGDFTLARVRFDNPNRSAADVYVRYGNRVVIEEVEAYDIRIGSSVVEPVIRTNCKLTGGKTGPTKGLIESTGTKVPAADVLDAYLSGGVYHIDPYRSLVPQSGRTARFRGQVARVVDGGGLSIRLHYNAFPGSASTRGVGVLTLRVTLSHDSGPANENAYSFIERRYFVTFGFTPEGAALTEIGSGAAVTPASGISDVSLSVGSVGLTSGTDGYVSFTATVGQTGATSSPKYSIEYACELTQIASA